MGQPLDAGALIARVQALRDAVYAGYFYEPVGAATSVERPARIAGQAAAWAAVGAGKLAWNQAATAGWNPPSAAAGSAGADVRVMATTMVASGAGLKTVDPARHSRERAGGEGRAA